MNTLPTEILQQVLAEVPKNCLPACRLVCRDFDTLSCPLLFANIPKWLDYKFSHQAITTLAHDAFNRPAVMWSPWATGPDGPVEKVWMDILWRLLVKTLPPGLIPDTKKKTTSTAAAVALTTSNFAELSGRPDVDAKMLRTAQNRYLLHRAYTGKRCDDGKYLEGGLF